MEEKVIVITGGSDGLGKTMAGYLSKEGGVPSYYPCHKRR